MLIISVTRFSLLKEVAMTCFSLHFEQVTVLSKYSVNTRLKYLTKYYVYYVFSQTIFVTC